MCELIVKYANRIYYVKGKDWEDAIENLPEKVKNGYFIIADLEELRLTSRGKKSGFVVF